jgi:WD40 repeat protein
LPVNYLNRGYEKNGRVWDLSSGKWKFDLDGHKDPIDHLEVTSNSQLAITGSFDGTIKVWDLSSGECLSSLNESPSSIFVAPDCRTLILEVDDIVVWDLVNKKKILTIDIFSKDGCSPLALTPNGQQFVTSTFDGGLQIWDLWTGKIVKTLEGHSKDIFDLAITQHNRYLISGSSDRMIKVWDIETGENLLILKGHQKATRDILVTDDGNRIVSSSYDNTIRVWNLETGEGRLLFPRSEWNG